MGALEGEVVVTEYELQQSHYIVRRQVCSFTECRVLMESFTCYSQSHVGGYAGKQ